MSWERVRTMTPPNSFFVLKRFHATWVLRNAFHLSLVVFIPADINLGWTRFNSSKIFSTRRACQAFSTARRCQSLVGGGVFLGCSEEVRVHLDNATVRGGSETIFGGSHSPIIPMTRSISESCREFCNRVRILRIASWFCFRRRFSYTVIPPQLFFLAKVLLSFARSPHVLERCNRLIVMYGMVGCMGEVDLFVLILKFSKY
jgi:hypothetical protein